MSNFNGPPHFSEERSKAIEHLLANVAQDGTPENRHFQNTKGKRILLSGVAVALAVSGAAIALQQPVTDRSSTACCAPAELHGNAKANFHDAYANIPSGEIQHVETDADYIWDAKDPYYGFNKVPVVARVHIDSIDGGRAFSPISNQYVYPQTIGKMTILEVYKGAIKPGDHLNYARVGGTVTLDEYWSSLNQAQKDKILHLNGGQKPTDKKYIQQKITDDVDVEVGKEYIAFLLPQSSKAGNLREYFMDGFQFGLREVKGSGAATSVLNNETKTWESLGSLVKLP